MPYGGWGWPCAVGLAMLVTAGCTDNADPGAGPARLPSTSAAGATVRPSEPPAVAGSLAGAPSSEPSAASRLPPLTPGMTPVPEAARCSVTTGLTSAAPLRPETIWPDSPHRGGSATQTVRRAGATCPDKVPTETTCDASFPFIAASEDDVLRGLGAQRLTTGEAHAEVAAPSGAIPSQAAILYTVLHFAASGTSATAVESAQARLDAAVKTCTGGRPGHLGADGLVGQRESVMAVRAFQDAHFVFARAGNDLVWLVVDGVGWTAATREAAARRAIDAITKEPTP